MILPLKGVSIDDDGTSLPTLVGMPPLYTLNNSHFNHSKKQMFWENNARLRRKPVPHNVSRVLFPHIQFFRKLMENF